MGQAVPRVDGKLKVTGAAKYPSDFQVSRPAYGFLVTSSISRRTIASFDESDSRKVPGVLLIMTHENTKVPGEFKFFANGGEACTERKPLSDNRVTHDGDYVAMIVAETYENAREAAHRLKVSYVAEHPTATMDQPGTEIREAVKVSKKHKDPKTGDADGALARNALELAMDEMAAKLDMDPVEFRRVNDTMVNPTNGAPYTSRSLMKCFDEAAKAFGWDKRNPKPASMRDGDWLIGWGCATATYPTQLNPSSARIRFDRQGNIRVQVAAQDIGTGAYTVIGQMAGLMLNQPIEKVLVELGDSQLPPGPVAGGSVTTASVCSAVKGACERIQTRLLQRSGEDAMQGVTPDQLAAALEKIGSNAIEELYEWVPPEAPKGAGEALYQGQVRIVGGPLEKKTMFAFGAEFVEVRVNRRTREIRVPRLVGAFAAGRIMNPRTARSQLMGGMIWGVSAALHEETEIDERNARYVNDNIAEYLIPVNADIQEVNVILVPEVDEKVNPAGVKGLGELGNVGTNAAVANAVYHATGKRIRNLPIRIEDFFA